MELYLCEEANFSHKVGYISRIYRFKYFFYICGFEESFSDMGESLTMCEQMIYT